MHAKETDLQESASAGDLFRLPSQPTEDPSTTETPLVSDDAPLALIPSLIHDMENRILRMDIMFKGVLTVQSVVSQ